MTKIQYAAPGESVTTLKFDGEPRAGCVKYAFIAAVICAIAVGWYLKGLTPAPAAAATAPATTAATAVAMTRPTLTPTPTGTRRPMEHAPNVTPVPATYTPTPIPDTPAAPTATPCVGYHRVKSGQNLSQIAAAWRVSVQSLKTANRIANPDIIHVGVVLTIPGRCSTPAPTTTNMPSSEPTITPTVKSLLGKGD